MSIRTRLTLTLVAFTVLPVLISGIILFYVTSAITIQRQQDALNLVVELKQNQVQNWLAGLYAGLNTEVLRDTTASRMPALLRGSATVLYRSLHDRQVDDFKASIQTFQIFDELFLLDPNGRVILSTNPNREGENYWQSVFFQNGMSSLAIEVNPPQVAGSTLPEGGVTPASTVLTIIVARPVETAGGRVLGVLAGRANPDGLMRIMADTANLGANSEVYLVGKHGLPLTALSQPILPLPTAAPGQAVPSAPVLALESLAVRRALIDRMAGAGRYANYAGSQVLGAYRWIPEMQAALVAEQAEAQALAPVNNIRTITIISALGSLLIAALAASLISRNFTRPIEQLAATAEKIASGSLEMRAPTGRMDEIGALAIAFNSMTAQLRVLISSLEGLVTERTRLLQNRSEQLQASVEVGRYATSILDTSLLIQRVVDLIRERFGLYYVGLFLVDENRQWAVLQAGTGQAGKAMLQRGHRLPIPTSAATAGTANQAAAARGIAPLARRADGGADTWPTGGAASMIGWAIANNQARIALQAEQDPMRLATPELPETRSEAAIPLRSRGQILGAISVQSATPGAFDKETLSIFQTMADQVATALDNARLFNQAQVALQEAQQAYTQMGHQAWLQRLRSRPTLLQRRQTPAAGQQGPSSETSTPAVLSVPIKARGQVIGRINLARRKALPARAPALAAEPDSTAAAGSAEARSASNLAIAAQPFDPQEINLIETLVDQMGVALDSARLFEQTQQQAERERLVGEVTGRLRASLDLQAVMQTAARELRSALDLEEVELRLGAVPTPTPIEAAQASVKSTEASPSNAAPAAAIASSEAAQQQPAEQAAEQPAKEQAKRP